MKLSITVPCYNEADNLPKLFEAFKNVIQRDDIELVVVNNGSTDQSAVVMNELIPHFPFIQRVDVKKNQGYGFGILSGLRASRGEFLGWTHADLQTPPNDVVRALDIIESHTSSETLYVKGDRKKRPWMDQFFTMGMSLFETLYLQKKLWDINAQPNIFHQKFFSSWQTQAPYDFSLDLFVLYQAKLQKLDIKRFPVEFPEREHGESKWNTGLTSKWKFIKRTMAFSRELKRKL
ncbi:MAG: glycosyltransferase family 2 protein [Pseudomonadota bacterium]